MGEGSDDVAMPLYQKVRMMGKKGDYAHAVLVSWGFVEMTIDVAVREEFDIPDVVDVFDDSDAIAYITPRDDFLTEAPFNKKLDFLRKTGYLTFPEWKAIDKFREQRNKIMHNYFDTPLSTWTPPETQQKDREAIIDMAVKAVHAIGEAMTRRNRERITKVQNSTAGGNEE